MFPRERIRAAIGLIAAYAIALQALFAALAPLPAGANGIDFGQLSGQVLCFGSGNAATPASGDSGTPMPASGKFHCVLCVSSGAAAILPEPVACAAERIAALSQFAPAAAKLVLAPAAARSGPSRAPPLTV